MTATIAGVVTVVHTVTSPPAEKVTPGFLGFAVMFVLALAVLGLIYSMVGHLRKVRYSPDPAAGSAAGSVTGSAAGSVTGSAAGSVTGDGGPSGEGTPRG